MTATDLLTAARAEALFLSDFPVGYEVTSEQVAAATRRAVRLYGGTRGYAAEAVVRYWERPETGVPRMRWARRAVEMAYGADRSRVHPAALILTSSPTKAA